MSMTEHYPKAARLVERNFRSAEGDPVMWVEQWWSPEELDPETATDDEKRRFSERDKLRSLEMQLDVCSRCTGLVNCTFKTDGGSTLDEGWVQAWRPVTNIWTDHEGVRKFEVSLKSWAAACNYQKAGQDLLAIERGHERARVPELHLESTLANYERFEPTAEYPKGTVDIAKIEEYLAEQLYLEGRWIFITGIPGSGKTHVLASIINEIIRIGKQPLYATTDDLVGQGSDTEDHFGKGVWGAAARSLVCGIDDFGHEQRTEWFMKRFDKLVDEIYSRGTGLVVTSNLNNIEFQGAISGRACSRFAERCDVVTLDTPDYRRR